MLRKDRGLFKGAELIFSEESDSSSISQSTNQKSGLIQSRHGKHMLNE